ncbi:MAG: Gfo/Idh/MocA family oxidoreductase [Tepidanaerobacter acetatoxydans]|uniref:Gfo/Idh/MocA family protein n=1 Tax=Tepidanaerobacter TaxID=499228 RepID=UPI000AC570F0|nr:MULTISPECIES: Gfo/Idh/MocA family oxidoreductase [Tepidanaerobacter]NLU10020.1 Gfo/Idh/MocA family oxidoreductase [Tepidanaerobacter acetatoxydans]
MGDIGFGIVGCGTIADTHALAISHIKDAQLIAVSSRNEDNAKQFSIKYECDYYTDYNDMLKRQDIDVINICVPSGLHAEIAIKAAEAGKHVIVDKPMEITIEKANRMIEVFQEKKLKLCVVFQRRYKNDIMIAKKIIDQGKLGRIFFGGCYIKWYRSQEYYDSSAWRGTWALDGGGVLMNQASHYIDLMQHFLGPVKEVYARSKTVNHCIEVEDLAIVNLEYTSGALGVIEATTSAYPGLCSRIDIYGTNGRIVIENDDIIELYTKNKEALFDKTQKQCPENPHVPFQRQFEQMMEAIRNDRDPEVNGNEGKKSLEIILAAYKSVFSKKSVKLPLKDSKFLEEFIQTNNQNLETTKMKSVNKLVKN